MNMKMNLRTHLCSISCFMSMPCFSSSSLWAKAQSTGSAGVSAHGVLSRSRRACSGSLKRNTWLFPMMIRFPGKAHVNSLTPDNTSLIYFFFCEKSDKASKRTWPQNDETGHSLSVDIRLRPFAGLQDDAAWKSNSTKWVQKVYERLKVNLGQRRPSPSPWGPVVLLKVQCSSLIKWPLRTMSWRVLAFSLPTLRKTKETDVKYLPCKDALFKTKGLKTHLVMPSLM